VNSEQSTAYDIAIKGTSHTVTYRFTGPLEYAIQDARDSMSILTDVHQAIIYTTGGTRITVLHKRGQ